MNSVLNNLTIYPVFHKQFVLPQKNYVTPIQGGKDLSIIDLNMMGDNSGDNISNLNATFCELTVVYFLWKNKHIQKATYWGLAHYRRYFCTDMHWTKIKLKNVYYLKATEASLQKIFSQKFEKKLEQFLSPNSVILSRKVKCRSKIDKSFISVKQFFYESHEPQAWELLRAAISEISPKYLKDFELVENASATSACNMMIAHTNVWDEFLEWMFPILFRVSQIYRLPEDDYQKRAIGFLSERLFDVFFSHHHNKYKVHYFPYAVLQ